MAKSPTKRIKRHLSAGAGYYGNSYAPQYRAPAAYPRAQAAYNQPVYTPSQQYYNSNNTNNTNYNQNAYGSTSNLYSTTTSSYAPVYTAPADGFLISLNNPRRAELLLKLSLPSNATSEDVRAQFMELEKTKTALVGGGRKSRHRSP